MREITIDSHQPQSVLAAILSYLVPGLGQIYQGRVAKGVLFLVCLTGMFVLGLKLGGWRNVYLPRDIPASSRSIGFFGSNIPLPSPLANLWHRKSFAGQAWIGVLAWPAIWQFANLPVPTQEANPFWHDMQRAPSDAELNAMLNASDKTPDLGWIYTVIAGVLNILVIYDAYAGPAFPPLRRKETDPAENHSPAKEVALP